jgi:hypothetical protein
VIAGFLMAALIMVVLWMMWDDWAPEWEGLWDGDYEDTGGPSYEDTGGPSEPDEHDLPPEYRFGDRPDWLVPAVAVPRSRSCS